MNACGKDISNLLIDLITILSITIINRRCRHSENLRVPQILNIDIMTPVVKTSSILKILFPLSMKACNVKLLPILHSDLERQR